MPLYLDDNVEPIEAQAPQTGASFMDPVKQFGASAVDLGTTAFTTGQYAAERGDMPNVAKMLRGMAMLTGATSDALEDSISEGGKRAAGAGFVTQPGQASVAEAPLSSFLMKSAGMAPGLAVMMAFPEGLIGKFAAGAGFQSAQTINSVIKATNSLTDAQLQAQSPVYKSFRADGLDEDAARAKLHAVQITGEDLAIAALTGAATMAPIAHVLQGGTSAVIGRLAGAGLGAVEAGTGMAASGMQGSYAQQSAAVAAGTQQQIDWHKALFDGFNAGMEGGFVGAGFGAMHAQPKAPKAPKPKETPATPPKPGVEYVDVAGPTTAEAAALADKVGTPPAPEAPQEPQGGPPAPETPPGPAPVAPAAAKAPVEPVAPVEAAKAPEKAPEKVEGPADAAPTVSEPRPTLEAQVKDLVDGNRDVVFFPKGTKRGDRPAKPEGMKSAQVPGEGVVYYNPKAITYNEIVTAKKEGRLGELLNMGRTSKDDAMAAVAKGAEPAAVVVRDEAGTPKVEAASSSDTAMRDATDMLAKAKPTDTVEVTRPEAVIQERQQAKVAPEPPPAALTPKVAEIVARTKAPEPKPEPTPVRVVEVTPELRAKYETKPATPPQPKQAAAVAAPVAPEPPKKPRILADTTDAEKARIEQSRAAQAEQIASVKETLKADKKAAEGGDETKSKNWTQEQRAARAANNERAVAVASNSDHFPTKAEDGFAAGEGAKTARAAILARASRMVEAAQNAGFEFPGAFRDAVDKGMQHNEAAILLNEAQALLRKARTKRGAQLEDYTRFITREKLARAGKRDELVSDRRVEASKDNLAKPEAPKGDEGTGEAEASRETVRVETHEAEDAVLDEVDRRRGKAPEEPEEEAPAAPPPVERPRVELKEGEGYTAATGPKTAVVVEKVKRRAVTPPGKTKFAPAKKSEEVHAKGWETAETSTEETFTPQHVYARHGFGTADQVTERHVEGTNGVGKFRHTVVRSAKLRDVLAKTDLSAQPRGLMRVLLPILRDKILRAAGDTDVHVARGDMPGQAGWWGYYQANEHRIVVSEALLHTDPQLWGRVVMHEALHAATSRALYMNEAFTKRIGKLMDHIRMHEPEAEKAYGMKNEHEFIADAFTNRDFQETLNSINITADLARELRIEGRPTLWGSVISLIRQAMGLPSRAMSTLEALTRVIEPEFGAYAKDKAGASTPRWELRGFDHQEVTSAVRDALPDARNLGARWRRGMDKLSSKTMLAQRAREVFKGTDAMDRIAAAGERIRVDREDILEKTGAADVVRELGELERKHGPEAWDAAVTVLHDLTRFNVSLDPNQNFGKDATGDWQRKHLAQELRQRFHALPDDMKELFVRVEALTRGIQNEEALQLTKNTLAKFGVNDEALATKITKGMPAKEVEEALKQHGLGPDVAAAIGKAQELRALDGFYVPLMRRGTHVVTGNVDFATPGNGKRIDPETVQFTHPSDVSARDMARDWAQQLADEGLNVANVRKVFVDRTDPTKIVEPQDLNATPAYRVRVQTQIMEMHANAASAMDRANELREQGVKNAAAEEAERIREGASNDLMSSEARTIERSLRQRQGYKNMTEASQKELTQALKEASVRLYGSARVQSKRLPRRNVIGASKDMVANIGEYAGSAAGYLSKLRHMPEIERAFEELQKYKTEHRYEAVDRTLRRSELLKDMEQRVYEQDNLQAPGAGNTVVRRLLQVSGLDKLAGVSFHVINSTEPWTTSMPVLGGRHGFGRSMGALAHAYNMIGARGALKAGIVDTKAAFSRDTGFTNYLDYFKQQMNGHPLAGRYGELLDHLHRVGLIDKETGFEVRHMADATSGVAGRALDRMDLMARQVGLAIESINRAVTGIAAYDMELKKNGFNHEAALRYATDVVHDTMGNYSASNAAPILRHPVGRLVFQFKKFGQKTYYLLGKTVGQAIKGDREAQKTFMGLMATHMVVAGALGLPWEPIRVGLMAANMLGVTGYTWDDFEQAARQVAAKALGKTGGEMLTRGVTRGLGFDTSSRFGLENLTVFGQPRSNKIEDIKSWMFDTSSGAPGSFLTDQIKTARYLTGAVRAGMEGDYAGVGKQALSAAETGIPIKGVTDVIKAFTGATEGRKTSNERQLMSPLNPLETAAQAIGFKPAREAEMREQQNAIRGDQRAYRDERQKFITKWVGADAEARGRMWGAIERWNRDKPTDAKLSRADLQQAVKRRQTEERDKTVVNGIRTTKRDRHLVEPNMIYNTD